jgi:predicted aspartyl protease
MRILRLLRAVAWAGFPLMMLAALASHAERATPVGRTGTVLAARAGTAACATRPIGSIAVSIRNLRPLVTASANGKSLTLLLDTGAQRTLLTPAAAGRIAARAPRVEFPGEMRSIAATMKTREVELQEFSIGGMDLPARRIHVYHPPAPFNVDGLLGIDILEQFDLDLDLFRGRVFVYAPRSCDTPGPDWPREFEAIRAVGYPGAHLQFTAHLNGRGVVAVLDTGAQRTTITARAAERIGLSGAALTDDRPIIVRGAAAEQVPSRIYKFSHLKIGDLAIFEPEIVVANVNLGPADLVFGMDFLRTHRVWISHGARQIFFSRPGSAGQ